LSTGHLDLGHHLGAQITLAQRPADSLLDPGGLSGTHTTATAARRYRGHESLQGGRVGLFDLVAKFCQGSPCYLDGLHAGRIHITTEQWVGTQ
jgi:hypothetical protein